MPFAAVVTIIGALLTVVVLAAYLIRVALILRRVDRKLGAVIDGLGAVVDKTQPIGPIVGEINSDLAGVDNALQDVLTKERSPLPEPWVVAMPRSSSAPPSRAPSPMTRSTGAAVQTRREMAEEPYAPGPDVVWGIKPKTGVGVLPQQFALVAGLVYVAIGVIGFFPTGFNDFTEDTNEKLLGLFAVTPMHNVVHLGVGALWLLAAFVLTRPAAEGTNLAIGGFYVLAAVLGYLGVLDLLAIEPGFGDLDFYLHLITGVVSLLFAGVLGSSDREPVDDEGVRV
ncbi:MAG: DUF4383 domain-containing protein [Actinobacteria bacterium]|nr:DUF4383 domain-containing protein [Actinomycetota bacterium]